MACKRRPIIGIRLVKTMIIKTPFCKEIISTLYNTVNGKKKGSSYRLTLKDTNDTRIGRK
jgi:hypothetical protein